MYLDDKNKNIIRKVKIHGQKQKYISMLTVLL